MNSVTINNVAVSDLPAAWQAHLHISADARVSVQIEPALSTQAAVAIADDPAFGIWRDRTDLDVANYVQQLRGTRYQPDNLTKK